MNKGFTLIEVMISFLIFSIMTSIVIISFSSLYKAQEKKQFLNLLIQDIYYAQQLAINTGLPTYVYFDNENQLYGIRQLREDIYTQSFDEKIQFQSGTLKLNELSFNSDGNARKSGAIIIRVEDEVYRIVVLLGRGRFYLEKA